ncbi:hypothetical protein HMPREF9080_00140 [Cardiobacterium valvarum F0432]|uniref:Uncharacterized protein n=1 Tax=Cardiobacterium valvarum F0432 TaxID=797473 RepID=G9ZBL6_9GAMM|nr:hypothetical protein HMPREF9080_00140 [Cardiobacterium valvarum F0432]
MVAIFSPCLLVHVWYSQSAKIGEGDGKKKPPKQAVYKGNIDQ